MSFFKIREILEYFFQYELFQYEWYEMNFELLFKNILPDLWILSYLKNISPDFYVTIWLNT